MHRNRIRRWVLSVIFAYDLIKYSVRGQVSNIKGKSFAMLNRLCNESNQLFTRLALSLR